MELRIRDGFKIPNMDNPVVKRKSPEILGSGQTTFIEWQTALLSTCTTSSKKSMPEECRLKSHCFPLWKALFVSNAKSRAKGSRTLAVYAGYRTPLRLRPVFLWKDERYDVLESTSAALTYLQRLYDEFGDWQLALAAYNWGEGGNIRRQIKKNQAAGKPTDYMSLKMPAGNQKLLSETAGTKGNRDESRKNTGLSRRSSITNLLSFRSSKEQGYRR